MDENVDPRFTIKVIGNQWYWSYEFNYINNLNLEDSKIELFNNENSFDSVMVTEEYLIEGQKRLLEVDNCLIIPTNVALRFIVTSSDVLHS
jgi:cytochrome c oxidase subunit 2